MNQDMTALIWDHLFMVSVQAIALQNLDEIREFGTYINPGYTSKQTMEMNYTTCMISIARMVEIYKRGFTITIPNRKDTVQIYDNISHYLHYWNTLSNTSININSIPTEDLITLDEFASNIFNIAKGSLIETQAPNLVSYLCSGFGYNPFGNMLSPVPVKSDMDERLKVAERIPLSDSFKSKLSINDIDLFNL